MQVVQAADPLDLGRAGRGDAQFLRGGVGVQVAERGVVRARHAGDGRQVGVAELVVDHRVRGQGGDDREAQVVVDVQRRFADLQIVEVARDVQVRMVVGDVRGAGRNNHAGGVGRLRIAAQRVVGDAVGLRTIDEGVQVQRQGLDRLAVGAEAQTAVVGVVAAVVGVAVAAFAGEGEAHGGLGRFMQRDVDHALRADQVVVADVDQAGGLEVHLRRVGDDVDRTADRAAAVQGALRALQHFDAADVEEAGREGRGARLEDAVDVHGDALVAGDAGVAGADAADEHGRRRAALLDHDAGHIGGQVGGVAHAQFIQLVAADGRDALRHLLDVLFTALGGDDDLLDGLSRGGACDHGGGDGRGGRE